MENNKKEDKKNMLCKKFAWCKDHHMFMPIAAIILSIFVFSAGLAIGHKFSREGGGRFGYLGYGRGGCMEQGFFQNERGFRGFGSLDSRYNSMRNLNNRKFRGQVWNNSGTLNSTSTTQDLNATSTLIE